MLRLQMERRHRKKIIESSEQIIRDLQTSGKFKQIKYKSYSRWYELKPSVFLRDQEKTPGQTEEWKPRGAQMHYFHLEQSQQSHTCLCI